MKTIILNGIVKEYGKIEASVSDLKMIEFCRKMPSGSCKDCKIGKQCDIFYRSHTTPNGFLLPKSYKSTNNWLKSHGLPVQRNKHINRREKK